MPSDRELIEQIRERNTDAFDVLGVGPPQLLTVKSLARAAATGIVDSLTDVDSRDSVDKRKVDKP